MKKVIAFLLAAVLGVSCGVFLSVVFQITSVTDNSMLPGYSEGDKILINKTSYRQDSPERGDVVLFPSEIFAETGEGRLMMKRVVAVAGDSVLITGGEVYVNNKVMEEQYLFAQKSSGEMTEVTVQPGSVFVLGDNRADSTDSRSEAVGLVGEDEILGKVIAKW